MATETKHAGRHPMPALLLALLAGGGVAPLDAARAQKAEAMPEEGGSVSGLDITRPLQRIELRTEFADEGEEDKTTFTLRQVHPVKLDDAWRLNLRTELPLVIANSPSEGSETGIGDIRLQAVAVHDTGGPRAWGFGLQVQLPTGNERLGRGQWQLLPILGHRWSLPTLSEESFFQLVARYRVSFGGERKQENISELQLAPNLEIGLPGRAYLSFFPSNDVRYDFKRDGLFVPINVEIGKEWKRVVVSLEGAKKVISTNDVQPYDWRVEARIGYRY